MKLSTLAKALPGSKIYGSKEVEISSLVDDSRKASKGSLFVAIKGLTVDAHNFIDQVIVNGAVCVVGEKKPNKNWLEKITYVQVKNSREGLGLLASTWYGTPSKKLKIVGVTGTKGKTTVSELTYHLLKTAGLKVGLVSSISAKIGGRKFDTGFHVTSPEPLALHGLLSQMVNAGCKYAVLEVTSHALDQDRFAGINFDIGVFTNISHEHLDYHKTFQNYLFAKSKLFENVDTAILNQDDKYFESVRCVVPEKSTLMSFGINNKEADLNATDLRIEKDGSEFDILTVDKKGKKQVHRQSTKLQGEFNVANILAAVATARSVGVSWNEITKGITNAPQVTGRLEKFKGSKSFDIYIDFAHTPKSLESVLTYLRKITAGKLISVFGCAGERDVQKRQMMGEISAGLADVSIITAEDPRSEKVGDIIDQIVNGAKRAGAKKLPKDASGKVSNKKANYYAIVPERGDAIHFAIQKVAQKGDTIVICGKGHEKSMAYNGVEYPWSDKKAIQFALKDKVLAIKRS